MNLVTILKNHGHRLKHEGQGNYRVPGHGGLIVNKGCWYSHSKGIGGKPDTLLLEMGLVYDENGSSEHYEYTQDSLQQNASLDSNLYPLGHSARNYLIRRGISAALIDEFDKKALIREDRKGYLCFVGYDDAGRVRCVSQRAIHANLNIQKYERRDSNKRFSFCIPGESTTCIIVEGPIDAISVACMEDMKCHSGYFRSTKVATCGAPAPHIVSRLKKLRPGLIIIAMDRDEPGQIMSKNLEHLLRDSGISTVIATGEGKDPNDWLIHRLELHSK